jgi:predicted nucleic acid-binding protein
LTSKTSKYVVDSCVWIDVLDGAERVQKSRTLLAEHQLFTTSLSLGEAVARTMRKGMDGAIAETAITSSSRIIPIDATIAVAAGRAYNDLRRIKPKISFSDVIALVTAQSLGAKLLTCDTDFEGIRGAIVLK